MRPLLYLFSKCGTGFMVHLIGMANGLQDNYSILWFLSWLEKEKKSIMHSIRKISFQQVATPAYIYLNSASATPGIDLCI